jgi:hypothetical protein
MSFKSDKSEDVIIGIIGELLTAVVNRGEVLDDDEPIVSTSSNNTLGVCRIRGIVNL